MRIKLKETGSNTRERYIANVERMGIKSNSFKGYPERTILLKNVVNTNTKEEVTDHLWFTVGKRLKELNLKSGDVISFNARVSLYRKGYRKESRDYKLNNMSKIVVEHRQNRELEEGEITSSTNPTFEELEEARSRKMMEFEKQRFEQMLNESNEVMKCQIQ